MKKNLEFIIGIIISIIIIILIVGYEYGKLNIIFGAIIIVISIVLATKIYTQKEIKVEKLFLYIVPIIMIAFLIGIPSWKNADERVHWFRIYDITQGNFYTKTMDGLAVGELPEGVIKYHNYSNELYIKYSDFAELYENEIKQDGEKALVELSTTAVYHPIQYLPQAIGVFIADIFTDKPFLLMYAARIMNMLVSLIILYFSIKIIPFGKKIMLLLTCIPVAISGFASMSPDAMTISIAYLFISYVLKIFNEKDKKIKWQEKIGLLLMGMVLALCKIVYVPIVALILILPKEKYNTRKEQILTCFLIIGLAIITNLLWLGFASQYLEEYKAGNSVIQLQKLLANPIEYLQNMLYTINSFSRDYLEGLFGIGVGADLHIQFYTILPIIIFGTYIFLTITDKALKNRFNTYQTIIITLILLAVIGLIFTSLYIQWTPANWSVIAGVQGRYFLPILPLLSLIIGNLIKIKSEYDENQITKILRNYTCNNICIYTVNCFN